MIISPYNTSYGSLMNNKILEDMLNKFIISSGGNLNYEYVANEAPNLFLITGKNDEELALPIWDFPMVFTDIKGNVNVLTDLRKYVKVTEGFNNVNDIIRDNNGFEFMMVATLVTYEMAAGNYGKFRNVERTIAGAYTHWLSSSLTAGVMLNPLEKLYVEIAIQHFFYLSMINGVIAKEDINTIINKISNGNNLSLPVNIKTIKAVVDGLSYDDLTVNGLVKNIKLVLGNGKSNMVDTSTLINIVSGSWFGPGGTDTVLICLEHVPTWIAVLYSSSNNKTYKKSRIANIIDKVKNKIKLNDFVKFMQLYIQEQVH